jgi:outer membrane protein TolC
MMSVRFSMLFMFVCSLSLNATELESLLGSEKQDVQKYKQSLLETTYEKQKYSWINPLSVALEYNRNESAQYNALGESKSAYINFNQDVFRSGGIYYSMDYATSQKNYSQISLDEENAALAQQIYQTLLNMMRYEKQIKQSELKIDNYEIEIFLKRQQYEAGDVDVTLLNNALMNRNQELKNLMSLKTLLKNSRIDLAKMSDLKQDEIPLPRFTLVSEAAFLEYNYNVQKQAKQSFLLNDQYKITHSSYLPKVSINAQYGITEYDNNDLNTNYEGNYYTAGLKVSMPLDFNTAATVEEAKISYLKSQSEMLEQKREQNAYYKQILSNIESFQEYIDLTKKNLVLYKELLDVTSKAVETGYKAGYDLKTLQNTNAIDEYEISINETNIQLELVKLHFMVREGGYDK